MSAYNANPIGILTPDGALIPCEPYEHLDLAQEMVEKMDTIPFAIKHNRMDCEVYLQQLGYIIVRGHDVYGLIGWRMDWIDENTEQILHLTSEQKKWLTDNYGSFPKDKQKTVDKMIDYSDKT